MNLLQITFAVSGLIILVVAFDVSRRQKFNALHFLVFLGIGTGLFVFTFVPEALNLLGQLFGIPRGADVLVYGGIIFLSYFSLLLLNKVEKNREDTTRLIREMALHTGAPTELEPHDDRDSNRPSPKTDRVGFLIRSYNEASRIGSVIDGIFQAGYSKILVVDDGSRDGTYAVLSKRPSVMVVRHPQNRGGGAALETGLEYYRRFGRNLGIDFVVTFDADGQHDVADLPNFFRAYDQDASLDVVFGSRFIVKTNSNVPFFRRLVLMGGKIFTRLIS